MNRMPTPAIVEEHVVSLKDVMEAKFEGNKTALDAALKTQKDASDKLESNFTKQLDILSERVGELRDAIKGSEGKSSGTSTTTGLMFTVLGAIVAFAGVAVAIVSLATRG